MSLVFLTLGGALVLFIQGRWRYDLVAMAALLFLTFTGTIAGADAFAGFGHPAVITVAAVLVVSRGLANSGLVDLLAQKVGGLASSPITLLVALTIVVTVLSAFMNNVGALALLMPVALRLAQKNEISPSMLLMPIAFGSLLGGMTTLIGTPPNIIIGAYRAQLEGGDGAGYGLFAFTPVGLGLALVGLVFLTLFSRRLIPLRAGQGDLEDLFDITNYTFEAMVPESQSSTTLRDLARVQFEHEFLILAIVRGKERLLAPGGDAMLMGGDRVIFETAPRALSDLLEATGWELANRDPNLSGIESTDIALVEAVVLPDSPLVRRSVREAGLRAVYGLNVLAVSRQGSRIPKRLVNLIFHGGDVLLLQGSRHNLPTTLSKLGCLPLAHRPIQLLRQPRLVASLAIFASAIALLLTGVQPAQTAFAGAALVMVLVGLVGVREAYDAIDWPILVLLAAMIPIGTAFEATGGADLVAGWLGQLAVQVPAPVAVAVVMVLTMFLSDLMNNAATAVLMAPVAVGVANQLGVAADPFLMAVAVGASCAFLTPIGHQSNTLVMGPGGYRFGDYWRLGLPLEVLIVLIGTPLILWVWPLAG